jgi:hypothetical protein
MNGLPPDFSTEFICGRTLNSLVVGRYAVNLCFSKDCIISVESAVSLDKCERSGLPSSILYLFQLIDRRVVSASSTTDGTLSLVFDSGETLHIYDSNERHESYNICVPGKILAVV